MAKEEGRPADAQGQDNLRKIQEHRKKIDAIDRQLVGLLNKRAVESLTIRELKPGAHLGLYDAAREEQIAQRVAEYNEGPLYDDNLKEIYSTILRVMKEAPSL